MPDAYPIQVDVHYPERTLNRLTTAFRVFTIIPIAIVLGSVSGETWSWSTSGTTRTVVAGAGGTLFFGPLLMHRSTRAARSAWSALRPANVHGSPSMPVRPAGQGAAGER